MPKRQHISEPKPKYPYTPRPASLRKLLETIPKKPKPSKLTLNAMKTWGIHKANDATPIGVLKKLGMVGTNGEPLEGYTDFMQSPPAGPRSLGARIRQHYQDVFESSHEPHKDSESLRNFFNIHAGGSERTIELQLQTFKALCDYADFSHDGESVPSVGDGGVAAAPGNKSSHGGPNAPLPPVNIDLHIHLPENKTTRDYEAIIQDIARYIYGRVEVNRE